MSERLIPVRQGKRAFAALMLASLLCCGFVAARALYSQQIEFTAFLWNLFLAWIPLAAATPVYVLRDKVATRWHAIAACAVLWFLFFPNAPYIVTDMKHLHERPLVPLWYDIITMMAFALTGLFVGYLSLYLMQEAVRRWWGRGASWIFALLMLGVSSYGIYLGRFVRWNSWDALLDPIHTVAGAAKIANPVTNQRAVLFSTSFFAFSLVCYLIVYSFTHLHAWTSLDSRPAAKD